MTEICNITLLSLLLEHATVQSKLIWFNRVKKILKDKSQFCFSNTLKVKILKKEATM